MREVVALVGTREVVLSQSTADEWYRSGLARWIGRNRLLITARFNPRGDLRGLSAVVGDAVTDSREEWARVFKRDQFMRRE
jgi:hypothetical protein